MPRGRPVTNHSERAQTRRDDRARLRSARLCIYSAECMRRPTAGSQYCAEHRLLFVAANARLYEARRLADQCRDCGVSVVGRSRCWLCSERRRQLPSRQPEYRRAKERT